MKQPKEQIPFAMAEGAAEESPHRADTLRKEIAEHDLSYHRDDAPVVSDLEYDRLAAELRALESDDPDAPERPVGAPPRPDLPTVRHPEPMLSPGQRVYRRGLPCLAQEDGRSLRNVPLSHVGRAQDRRAGHTASVPGRGPDDGSHPGGRAHRGGRHRQRQERAGPARKTSGNTSGNAFGRHPSPGRGLHAEVGVPAGEPRTRGTGRVPVRQPPERRRRHPSGNRTPSSPRPGASGPGSTPTRARPPA